MIICEKFKVKYKKLLRCLFLFVLRYEWDLEFVLLFVICLLEVNYEFVELCYCISNLVMYNLC